MFYLVEKAGLIDSLYRGSWKSSKRHGYGIQLFPNGARFIGNWKNNYAEGFGRLEFPNHTFYEGNFSKNNILEGKLQYYNGTCFEGQFDGIKEIFKKGKITFSDNEIFKGIWSPEGIILNGYILTRDKKRLYLEGQNLVREPENGISAKIIYWNKGIIYEGGLIKTSYDKQGFVYGNFMHPFYFECNYEARKYNGKYYYHSFYYGFSTEEYYSKGKEVGTWKYQTVSGYEYVGDTSSKKQIVRFPYMNKDYYEGELKIWCDKITLISGIYYMFEKERNDYKQIRVINCANINKHKDVVKRFNTFEEVAEILNEKRTKYKREFLSTKSVAVHEYGEGTKYYGHIINDYITCHKNDLFDLLMLKIKPNKYRYNIEDLEHYFLNFTASPELPKINLNLVKIFRGMLLDGREHGYCQIVYNDESAYNGFFKHGKREGFGFYNAKDKFRFIGYFKNNEMNGQGLMYTYDKKVFKGNFENGAIRGLGIIHYLSSNLEYFGEILSNIKNGKGAIKFNNKYKFEGFFTNDNIDTSKHKGVLINKDQDLIEEGIFVPSTDMSLGFYQTNNGYYVFDFKKGLVRKAE